MTTTPAWGTTGATAVLAPMTIERRAVGPLDVQIAVDYCGICHSDLHTARNEWGNTVYPAVVGHEIIGRVTQTGADVTTHQVGDRVGVGCLVDSCGACDECAEGLEQFCRRSTGTYNNPDRVSGGMTYGGYSASVVVTERFVLRVPESLDPAEAAPILCAGITMYSPLRHHRAGPGTRLAVAGFGGLGGMAVKLGKAMGADVTVLSRTTSKAEQARKAGADNVVAMNDKDTLKQLPRFDLILSTIPVDHDLTPYLRLLKRDGAYVVLGAVEPLTSPIHGGMLAAKRLTVTGSAIGGIAETQDLLDFCAEHGIGSDVQIIAMDGVNDAYDQLHSGDPGFRYVIDMSTLVAATH